MNFLKQNWFKVGVLIILIAFLGGILYVVKLKKMGSSVGSLGSISPSPLISIEPTQIIPFVDTIPPKISSHCLFLSSNFQKYEQGVERVCIDIGNWSGYLNAVNSVPITGKVFGDVKSIVVDGKKITWDENNEIYQRINLYIYGGLNKYKVVVEDMNGNKSTGYVETDAQNTDNDVDLNVND